MCARAFLNSDVYVLERMSSAAVRESLLAELKHAVTQGPGETKLLRLEAFLKPMYAALRKNEFGNLELKGVSNVLHRFFVERHGWHVEAWNPVPETRASRQPPASCRTVCRVTF